MKRLYKLVQQRRRQLHLHMPPSGLGERLCELPAHRVLAAEDTRLASLAQFQPGPLETLVVGTCTEPHGKR